MTNAKVVYSTDSDLVESSFRFLFSVLNRCPLLFYRRVVFILYFFLLISTNGCMDDVAASVGFAGWAFAAMCVHALLSPFYSFHCFSAFYTEGYLFPFLDFANFWNDGY